MHKRSSCAKIATVRRCSSVAARKIRTAISLRFAAISFRTGRTIGGTVGGRDPAAARAGPAVAAGDLEGLEVEVRVRGIWAKAAGLSTTGPEGKSQVWVPDRRFSQVCIRIRRNFQRTSIETGRVETKRKADRLKFQPPLAHACSYECERVE